MGPAGRRAGNYLKQPLNWVLAVASHIGVLRALKEAREGMSGRAVARAAGFTHQAAREAVARLEDLGIVLRLGSGRTQLIRLNFEHVLVRDVILPMFAAERAAMGGIRAAIRNEFAGKAEAATLFGSVARGDAAPGSDLDLLVVAPKGEKENLYARASALGEKALSGYGIRVSPIVLTVPELRRRARSSEPLVANIIAEGVDLLANKLGDLIR